MFELTISSSCSESFLIERLALNLDPIIKDVGGVLVFGLFEGRAAMTLAAKKEKKDYIKSIVISEIADVIVSHYKYNFLMNSISYSNESEKETLVKALTEFDKSTDKDLAIKNITFSNNILLDSLYHFKLKDLKDRWVNIADLVSNNLPSLIAGDCLIDMMKFLIKQSPPKIEELYIIDNDDEVLLIKGNLTSKCNLSFKKSSKSFERDIIDNLISLSPRKIFITRDAYAKIKFADKIEDLFEGKVYITR